MKGDSFDFRAIKLPTLVLLAAPLVFPAVSAHALECANRAGGAAWATAPDDNGLPVSTACGNAAVASGVGGTALGSGAEALGQSSTALGIGTEALGENGIALGNDAMAAEEEAVAIGWMAESLGVGGVALGGSADAGDSLATAVGLRAEAQGIASVALGNHSYSSEDFSISIGHATNFLWIDGDYLPNGSSSIAIGANSRASGDDAVAIGPFAIAAGNRSVAIGNRAVAQNNNTIVLGSIPGFHGAPAYADVAIGTTAPLAPLHVARNNGAAGILVTETHQATGPRTLLELENNGNPEFRLTNTANNNSWVFSAGLRFVVKNNLGDWVMRVTDTGDMEIGGDMNVGGTLTEMSDRNEKHAVEPLAGEWVLEKLAQVPVSEWSYKGEAADQRHIGPMAQDFYAAFGLASGETRISARDMAGVNMAAVKALENRNRELEMKNAALEERLELVESLVAQLLPKTAQN
ncbi:hypothetical protein F3N42_11035 [Marinihelvus fidelis]|uniref:Peptidase S74 domain-containing protein n=1 Tax=Marinihelvus fidelis TaxID=2613842 RepID=A0A5N0T840_9GAMM|nr:tail fiber domain-containing protein [Marinihelvus fidelis]KAA9130888.1 hypothetical protein F3N42_11035 [Marinihelvus fidelis]